ncbi:MAG TPA: YdeI/OmpD-associated family protein [Gemmatimonadales bacterium]|nr:YdeI/OmpD-associated family protein [Gemmatimonadales bacterium]
MTRDPRIDGYIANAAEFARPILTHLREVVHAACPEAEETMKWSAPHFMYKGMLCGMQAFKAHCAFGFWKGSLVVGRNGENADGMGQFGRITAISDLPSRKVLTGLIKQAMALNDQGIKSPTRTNRKPRPEAKVPPDLVAALEKNRKARATFEGFSPSHRREYVEWITEARTEPTRLRRLATAVEWLAEGKARNWKYLG